MSQNDFNIANQGFPQFRADLNSALQALASTSSGATAPGTAYAYQFWYDTSTNLLKMRNADNDGWITLALFDQTADEWEIRSAVIQAVDGAGVTIKTDDGVARITVADNGNVGIGTSSPNEKLQVAGTVGSIAASGSNGLLVGDFGADAGTFKIDAVSGRSLRFVDFYAGSERMRIDSSGNLLVAKTATGHTVAGIDMGANGRLAAGLSGGQFWDIDRRDVIGTVLNFRYAGTAVGSISVTSVSTAYNTSSDYRLKENVVPLAGAADRLAQIPVYRFNFIADPDTTVDGFLAHEVQEFVPECVTGQKDEVDAEGNPVYQGIDQSKLVPLLTAALQEALTKIEDLETRIVALETQ